MQIKVFRKPRLHAKAYIFGGLGDGKSVGIIGSSNFTKAGLTTSQELNFLTDDYKIVEFVPQSENQESGHITWFDELWNDEGAEFWTGISRKSLVTVLLGIRLMALMMCILKH